MEGWGGAHAAQGWSGETTRRRRGIQEGEVMGDGGLKWGEAAVGRGLHGQREEAWVCCKGVLPTMVVAHSRVWWGGGLLAVRETGMV